MKREMQFGLIIMIYCVFVCFHHTGAFLLLAAGLCAIGSAFALYIIQPYEAIFKWVNIYTCFIERTAGKRCDIGRMAHQASQMNRSNHYTLITRQL